MEEDFSPDYSALGELINEFLMSSSESLEEGEIDNTIPTIQPVRQEEVPRKEPKKSPGYEIKDHTFSCLICKIGYTRLATLRRHWDTIHKPTVTIYQCEDCQRQIVRLEDLIHHGKVQHQWHHNRQSQIRESAIGKEQQNQRYKDPKGQLGPDDQKKDLRTRIGKKPSPPTSVLPAIPAFVPIVQTQVEAVPEPVVTPRPEVSSPYQPLILPPSVLSPPLPDFSTPLATSSPRRPSEPWKPPPYRTQKKSYHCLNHYSKGSKSRNSSSHPSTRTRHKRSRRAPCSQHKTEAAGNENTNRWQRRHPEGEETKTGGRKESAGITH